MKPDFKFRNYSYAEYWWTQIPLEVLAQVDPVSYSGFTNFEMFISRKRRELAKMLVRDFHRGWHLPSNGTTANIVLCDLVLNFQVQTIKVAILTSKGWKIQALQLSLHRKSDICHRMAPLRMLYIKWLWPTFSRSRFVTVNIYKTVRAIEELSIKTLQRLIFPIEFNYCECFTPWPSPEILLSQIWNVNISETVRSSAKIRHMTCHRMAPLSMLYSVTLTFLFKVRHFLIMHLL